MPHIEYTKTGGSITYDWRDWLGGVDFGGGVSDNGIIGDSLTFSSRGDPFRYLGYISPGKQAVNVTNVSTITEYLRNGVVYGQKAYCVSNGSLLQQITGLSTTGTVTNSGGVFPHTISDGHSSPIGDDCCIYYIGSNPFWFYSFNDATDWNVGRYDFASTFDDDYMSTIPTTPLGGSYITGGKGFPHPLIVADDDVLYIGDRNFVHAYDGATNTFFAAVLTLPAGFIITSFAKTNDRKLAIGGYYLIASSGTQPELYEGQSKVWIWNLLDLDPDFAYDLHDNYVSEIRNWNGNIIAFTQGSGTLASNADCKLQVLENGDFHPLFQWTNGLPIRGGVETSQDEIYWNAAGTLNSYTKNPYTGTYIYNYLTVGNGTTSGLLKTFFSLRIPEFFMSSGASTTGGLQTFTANYAPAANVYPKVTYPVFPELKRGRLKKVTINYKSTASGGLFFKIITLLDKTDARETFEETQSVTNLKQIIIDDDKNGIPLGDFTCIQPLLVWSSGLQTDSPVVESVVYDFEYINNSEQS